MAGATNAVQLPAAWNLAKLGQVLAQKDSRERVSDTNLYRLLGVRLAGKGPFLREEKEGQHVQASHLSRVHAGDFIYSRLFAWRGAFGIIPQEFDGAHVSNEFPIFSVDSTRLDANFLRLYFLQRAVWSDVETYCTGTTKASRNRLKEEAFLAMEIPLPPLYEQRRIVANIEEICSKVEAASVLRQEAAEALREFERSALAQTLDDSTPRGLLKNLLAPGTSISYGVLVPGPDVPDGVPFVRVQDLDSRHPPEMPAKRILPGVAERYSRTRLNGGEVLIGVVGSIGKIGFAPHSWAGANIARAVCRLVPGNQINGEYLLRVLESEGIQKYFRDATKTLAQPTLNVGLLEQTPVPVPTLPEQKRIVHYLNRLQKEVDSLKSLQKETAAELNELMPSALSKAFAGKL